VRFCRAAFSFAPRGFTLVSVMRAAALLSLLLIPSPAFSQPATATRTPSLPDLSSAFERLVDRVSPAVVQIFATAYAAPSAEEGEASSLVTTERTSGSGVLLDSDGYIVTNAHVVEGAIRVQVELAAASAGEPPGKSILKRRGRIVGAQIVAVDRETDIAVLKVEGSNLPTLPLGDSDLLRPGQIVMAFGSPLGLNSSVTMGVVSAVARQLEPEDPMIYIQTDAPINPGNSGGPLVDAEGRVVGINTLIYSQSGGHEGIGFAAPSNIVRNVFDQIRKTGRVRRGEIGVRTQTITPLIAEGLGLSQDWGVVIADVEPDGPGARAGLQTGDIVLTLDGKPMENGRQFQVNFYARSIGQPVTLDLLRGDARVTARVTVAERPGDPDRFAEFVKPEDHIVSRLGILGIDLDARIAGLLPSLRRREGVVVAAISPAAPPSQQGSLRPGDVIYRVNRADVKNLAALRAAIAAIKPGQALVLQIEREGRLRYIAFAID
jgi:serine protease Do